MTVSAQTQGARRTQQERREATIAKLLDAAVSSLGEVGYARTTVLEICERAGVSQGGLFRHFATRLDLLIAAADRVRAQQFESFDLGLRALGRDEDSIAASLRLLRERCRSPGNAAWYELLNAARNDAALREKLAPLTARYHAEIAALGRTLLEGSGIPSPLIDTVLFTVVHLFDGEAMAAVVHAQPEQEAMRVELLVRMLRGGALFAAPPPSPTSPSSPPARTAPRP